MPNADLRNANKAKQDEFYTSITDIEKELRYYKKFFNNKVVYCNCDDPRVSNFFHHFSNQFENLKLKKLITTCYKNKNLDLFSKNDSKKAIYLEYNGDKNGNNIPDIEEIGIKELKGDGDFRSEECIELLKKADIVVTNPPFSLFIPYVQQLLKYKKKFLIIGRLTAFSYKDIFPLLKNNLMWVGPSIHSGDREFGVPKNYTLRSQSQRIDENGNKFISVSGVRWFTNINYKEKIEDIVLYKKYNKSEYPKYENYNAINVNKTKEIPKDYAGHMGVPITFFDKYNPNQFEIIGLGIAGLGLAIGVKPYKKEHKKYRKEIQKRAAVDGDLYFAKENGEIEVPFSRIIIRNKLKIT